jgi:hypothetical protein
MNKTQKKIVQKWKKANVKITRELRDIIHGYIMSDGFVKPGGSLQVDQGKDQENFVNWLFEKFEPIRTDHPITTITRQYKNRKPTYSCRFFTKSLLQGFRYMWYKPYTTQEGTTKYRKCLPNSINCVLNSTVITLWFAGDGTKTIGSKGAKIDVTAFTASERLRLKELFLQKFGISVNIIRSGVSSKGNEQWVLAINANDYDKFRDLITQIDLIPKYFSYKLHKKS